MTQNTLGDLNNHLFAELERLGNEDMDDAQLSKEIDRAKAISDVAVQVVSNASLVLRAKVAYDDNLSADPKDRPKLLEG